MDCSSAYHNDKNETNKRYKEEETLSNGEQFFHCKNCSVVNLWDFGSMGIFL